MNEAPLARREIQINEGVALTRPAQPEGSTMTHEIAGLTTYGGVHHFSASMDDDGTHAGHALLPCPMCGGNDLELANTHTPSYWIECCDCETQAHGDLPEGGGGTIRTRRACLRLHKAAIESAVAKWNARAAAPASDNTHAQAFASFHVSDDDALEWARRHNLEGALRHSGEARQAIEDARSLHLLIAERDAKGA
ncbi:hypothetical protein PPN31114_03534 [Pandoraea pneumonica]|uniref:Restriction alleviation protein, Lar family n=1 Tax=Pandoraea pneumonica TaxID=2508299 RepID=A0A5E4WXN1_9BURK|nr:hypothetical protein [Pandoraea pneumonica]VVE28629.1 hypothetical protein PPN31114_03534 [Pandoraea pneumonica]